MQIADSKQHFDDNWEKLFGKQPKLVCKVYQRLRDSLMQRLAKGTPDEAKVAST